MFHYSAKDAERLCSDQIIDSVGSVVKELIDNSLDAGATVIEVRLKENGLESIEVIDNGSGVPECSFDKLCARYFTSKISELEDLSSLSTMGFRGEALNSICNMCQVVKILTKTEEAEIGTKIFYDRNGNITQTMTFPRTQGTTVTVEKLFAHVPVRRKYIEQHHKEELKKLNFLMNSYALAQISVKFSLSNSINGTTNKMLMIEAASTLEDRLPLVLCNVKKFVSFTKCNVHSEIADEFGVNLDDPSTQELIEKTEIDGLISSPGDGRSSGETQFFSINSRPVDLPTLAKILNQVYRSYDPKGSSKVYPFFSINIKLPPQNIDPNFTPDKRTVLITGDQVLNTLVKSCVINVYGADSVCLNQSKFSNSCSQVVYRNDSERGDPEPASQAANKSMTPLITDFFELSHIDPPSPERTRPNMIAVPSTPDDLIDDSPTVTTSKARDSPEIILCEREPTRSTSLDRRESEELTSPLNSLMSNGAKRNTAPGPIDESPDGKRPRTSTSNVPSPINLSDCGTSVTVRSPPEQIDLLDAYDTSNTEASDTNRNRHWKKGEKIISLNLVKARSRHTAETTVNEIPCQRLPELDEIPEEEAISELQRRLCQDDFARMNIIGQFNRGFILCQLDDDLFVIDQHAADERCNFDHLLKYTTLEGQKLIIPQRMKLNPFEEQTVLDHEELFTKNGFRLTVDQSLPFGKRISLVSVPSARDLILCRKDFEEMVQTIIDAPHRPRLIRPSRVKELLASKACRKSIMINDSLNFGQVKRLMKKLHETDAPWTCAHGRPTVRMLGKCAFESVQPLNQFNIELNQ